MCEPILSPIGIMAVSAPSVNKAMPIIKRTAPIMNETSIYFGMGKKNCSSSTIAVTGRTDANASLSFSVICFLIDCLFLFPFICKA